VVDTLPIELPAILKRVVLSHFVSFSHHTLGASDYILAQVESHAVHGLDNSDSAVRTLSRSVGA
jgi:hypothetical protein